MSRAANQWPTAPHQCAGVILRDDQNRILTVRQAYDLRLWGVPGGVVDPGETPHRAAVREALEEIGVHVELTGIIGSYLLMGGGWPDIQAYMFTANITAGTPRVVDKREIAALEWRSPADLPSPLLPDVAAALEDLRMGHAGAVRGVTRQLDLGRVPL
ncbi:NUDIX hydrolase [Deinococcus fonticola]|uniref:NUDIX hydrolase n=1 Tax=Deinococcus fonticola TaxID=2528713 RepID=UPI0023EA67B7|nr:NUDIX hydrolase [Deinococcus fonticola]